MTFNLRAGLLRLSGYSTADDGMSTSVGLTNTVHSTSPLSSQNSQTKYELKA
jgi:hypothetical protein